jgi:hypothetical protein
MAARKGITRFLVGALAAFACAGGRGTGVQSSDDPDPATFDCHAYGTSAEFEGLEADTRERLRSMCELEAEFEQFAAARRGCKSSDECVTVATSCPFGCATAVASISRDEVHAKFEELRERFRVGGSSCEYECDGAGEAACVQGVCALERR